MLDINHISLFFNSIPRSIVVPAQVGAGAA